MARINMNSSYKQDALAFTLSFIDLLTKDNYIYTVIQAQRYGIVTYSNCGVGSLEGASTVFGALPASIGTVGIAMNMKRQIKWRTVSSCTTNLKQLNGARERALAEGDIEASKSAAGLVKAEYLRAIPTCPIDGKPYNFPASEDDSPTCPNHHEHDHNVNLD